MVGRPKFRKDLAALDSIGEQQIQEMLESGASIASICTALNIGKRALYKWLEEPERAAIVSRARAKAADQLVAETLEIADSVQEETNAINKARLRVDARKWVAAKWNPAAYADNKQAQVVVNIGDLHLKAVRELSTITIQSTDVESNVIDGEAVEVSSDATHDQVKSIT